MIRSKRAFTVPELMLSVSLMTVIGLAVATVASGLSNAYRETDDLEDAVQSSRIAMTNIETTIRKAKLVVSQTTDSLAVWTGDDNGDGKISTDELVLFRSGVAGKTITVDSVKFPDDMYTKTRTALNTGTTDLSRISRISSVDMTMRSPTVANYSSQKVLANDVQYLKFKTDVPPPKTQLVWIKMIIGDDPDRQVEMTNSVRLRTPAFEYLDSYRGEWHIELPRTSDGDAVNTSDFQNDADLMQAVNAVLGR